MITLLNLVLRPIPPSKKVIDMHCSHSRRLVASTFAFALNLFAAQGSAADLDQAGNLSFSHFYVYGKALTGREDGYTFGADLLFAWWGTEGTLGGRPLVGGITSEILFGIGNFEDESEELRLRYDVNADFFGIAAGYSLTKDLTVGALYNPFNLYSSPAIALLGSKFEIHAGYKSLEVVAARSGAGYGYGFIAPATDGDAVTADLRLHTGWGTFGVRYLRETPNNEDANNGVMLLWGKE